MQYLPVAPLATSTSIVRLLREVEAHEADEKIVAELVRTRLRLDKLRGWLLLLGLMSTVGAVIGVGFALHGQKVLLGVLAPVVASVPFGLGLFAERACWSWFVSTAKSHGLSEKAARRIYDGALGADHWIGVLASCGRPPTDGEIARFVTAR